MQRHRSQGWTQRYVQDKLFLLSREEVNCRSLLEVSVRWVPSLLLVILLLWVESSCICLASHGSCWDIILGKLVKLLLRLSGLRLSTTSSERSWVKLLRSLLSWLRIKRLRYKRRLWLLLEWVVSWHKLLRHACWEEFTNCIAVWGLLLRRVIFKTRPKLVEVHHFLVHLLNLLRGKIKIWAYTWVRQSWGGHKLLGLNCLLHFTILLCQFSLLALFHKPLLVFSDTLLLLLVISFLLFFILFALIKVHKVVVLVVPTFGSSIFVALLTVLDDRLHQRSY